jgi:hypothetical protein
VITLRYRELTIRPKFTGVYRELQITADVTELYRTSIVNNNNQQQQKPGTCMFLTHTHMRAQQQQESHQQCRHTVTSTAQAHNDICRQYLFFSYGVKKNAVTSMAPALLSIYTLYAGSLVPPSIVASSDGAIRLHWRIHMEELDESGLEVAREDPQELP